MKIYILYFALTILTISCKGQSNETIKINSLNVTEIVIKNKLSYSQQKLAEGKLVITNRDKIEAILNSLSHSKKIIDPPNLNANYGFFDIEIIDGKKSNLYAIVYTVYHGIIISDNNSTNRYKNDELEQIVYGLFVN